MTSLHFRQYCINHILGIICRCYDTQTQVINFLCSPHLMYDSPPDCMQKLRNIQMQVLFCLIHDDWLSTKSDCISDCIPVFLSSMSNTSLASTLLRLSAVEPTFHETCPQKTWIAILLKPCQQKNFEIKCVCSYRFRYI